MQLERIGSGPLHALGVANLEMKDHEASVAQDVDCFRQKTSPALEDEALETADEGEALDELPDRPASTICVPEASEARMTCLNGALMARDRRIRGMIRELRTKALIIADMTSTAQQMNRELEARDLMLAAVRRDLSSRYTALEDRESRVDALTREWMSMDASVVELTQDLGAKKDKIAQLMLDLAARDAALASAAQSKRDSVVDPGAAEAATASREAKDGGVPFTPQMMAATGSLLGNTEGVCMVPEKPEEKAWTLKSFPFLAEQHPIEVAQCCVDALPPALALMTDIKTDEQTAAMTAATAPNGTIDSAANMDSAAHIDSAAQTMRAVMEALSPGAVTRVMPLMVDSVGNTKQPEEQVCTLRLLKLVAEANLKIEEKAVVLESMVIDGTIESKHIVPKMMAVLGKPAIIGEIVEKLASVVFAQAVETPTQG